MTKRRAILDYQPTHVPLSILNEDYQPPTPEGEEPSLGDMWEAARYRHNVGESLARQKEAQDTGGYDEDYKVDMGELTKYNDKGYSDEELEFLAGSTSNENFSFREERILKDKQVKQTIEAGGITGTAVELTAATFDESMLPLMLLGGGAPQKAGTVAKIGWGMLRGAGEGVLSEYLLKQGDTQRTNEDLLMSAVGGMAFSGAIDVTTMAGKAALSRANVVEAVHRKAFKDFDIGNGYNKADDVLSNHQPDPVARKRTLSEKEIVDTLRMEAGERQPALSAKKVKGLKDEFRAYRKEKLELIEKIKLRPTAKRSGIQREVKQVEAAIAKRQSELDAKINENRLALSQNSNVDALQQGAIPDGMMARYKELKAERGEFDTEPSKAGKDLVAGRVIKPATDEMEEEVASQSVGAMKTRREFQDINTYDELLTESDVAEVQTALSNAEELANKIPRNKGIFQGKVMRGMKSMYSEIDEAPDSATRGLNAMLIKNPQRTVKGHQSAEELSETLFNRGAVHYMDYENALDAYAKEQGIGITDIGARNKASLEFERQTVMMQVSGNLLSNNPVDGDSAIMLGAKARSRLYEEGLKNNQNYNVIGFDKIKHRHEYHSVVFDTTNLISNSGHADHIYNAIASAYETGGIKLSRESALRLAQNQVARTMALGGKSHKSFDRFMSDVEFKKMEEELLANGVSKDIVDDIKESVFNKEMMGEISPRAMFSLRPNLKARSGDVWLVDLIDTSINRNMKYLSDSSGNAGLASQGFHSKHQFQRAVASARDAAINELRNDADLYKGTKAGDEASKALADVTDGKYANRLDEALRLMYREPLEDHEGIFDYTRALRKAASVVRLRTTGITTLPEYANAMYRNGIASMIKQMPSARFFDLRESSIEKDAFMKSFSNSFSMTGHQEYMFGRKFYNGADFDDMTKGKIAKIDKGLGHALDITMTVNGFKTFQHGGEETVARSMVSNIQDMAKKGEITPEIRKSLIDAGGMTEDELTNIINIMRDNPDLDSFSLVKKLDHVSHDRLATAMRNNMGSSFMRMGIGEQPAYMNKEMGKVMTTLMSFTIGSYEKLLARGINNERAMIMSVTAGQAMLGYIGLMANTYIQAQGLSGSERKRFIERRMGDDALFFGVLNRIGTFAAPVMALQAANSLGALPESMRGAGTMGGVQSVEIIKDSANATSAALGLAVKKQSQRDEDESWKAIQKVLPWYNSTLYNLTFGVATNN
ncbi:internal virion protein with endolysin domain [Vibrio phage D529]